MGAEAANRRRWLVAAALAALAALGATACQLVAPQHRPAGLAVTAEVGAGAALSIGGTTVEARLEALDGAVTEWQVDGAVAAPWQPGAGAEPAPTHVVVAPGDYTLVVWTVHHSDDIGCGVDPKASGGMRCHRDSHVVATCRAAIHVPAGSGVAYRYVRNGDDRCRLEPA